MGLGRLTQVSYRSLFRHQEVEAVQRFLSAMAGLAGQIVTVLRPFERVSIQHGEEWKTCDSPGSLFGHWCFRADSIQVRVTDCVADADVETYLPGPWWETLARVPFAWTGRTACCDRPARFRQSLGFVETTEVLSGELLEISGFMKELVKRRERAWNLLPSFGTVPLEGLSETIRTVEEEASKYPDASDARVDRDAADERPPS